MMAVGPTRRAAGRVALALVMLSAVGVPAAASLDHSEPRAPGPPESVTDALTALVDVRAKTGEIARRVGGIAMRVGQARVAITTIRGGIRADERRLRDKQQRVLASALDAGATEAGAGEVVDVDALKTDPSASALFDALRPGHSLETLLAAEIRYQEYQADVMTRWLEELTIELRRLGFDLGRRQKSLETTLASAREAAFRLRAAGGLPLEEVRDAGSSRAAFPGLETISAADPQTTIAKVSKTHERVRARRRQLSALRGELDTARAAVARHRDRLDRSRAGSILPAADDSLLFPFLDGAGAGVTTGGACERSIHSSIRLSDAQIAEHARAAGFEGFDLSMAVAIAIAESGGDPQAVCVNYSGTRDEGLWQINSMHGEAPTCTFEPACAARVAFRLYHRRGRSFEDWTVFNSGAVATHLPRAALAALLLGEDPFAFFEVCPVDAPRSYSNDWGASRGGGTRSHEGNDIFAARGTRIRAPFAGTAVAADNGLGGKSVSVYGTRGHVYNAHLSRYGRLGAVRAGQVIGYVGTTGNAVGTSPHNHFQWHPADGEPINPYPYLNAVCL